MSHSCNSITALCFLCLTAGVLTPGGARAQEPDVASLEPRQEVYSVAPTRNGDIELLVDLYMPVDRPAKGAVVLMHGGGFSGGHREIEENRIYGTALARRGFIAAAISYRLHGDGPVISGWAEEYTSMVAGLDDPRLVGAIEQFGPDFPVAVGAAGVDLVAAVGWLRDHAGELGFDPENIALFGASAGAITALTTTYAMERYGAESLDVASVIDLRGFLLTEPGASNPFSERDPPLLMLHGEVDESVPLSDSETEFRLAKQGGLHVEFYTTPDFGHELAGRELLELRLGPDETVLDRMDDFVMASFEGGPVPTRSLRGRLYPADHRFDDAAPDSRNGYGSAGDHARFRSRLGAAVEELIRSVTAESAFVAELYGISKPDQLKPEFDDPARQDWSYWPRERAGLSLRHMTAVQREHVHTILRTLLSSRGYLKVNHIMMLEELLADIETFGFARGAEEYMMVVFGSPTLDAPWGLRFEGHHLSLNVTLAPDGISVTPTFLGASPSPISEGIRAGFDPLAHERALALDLLGSLDEGQREAAVIADETPGDILSTQFMQDRQAWGDWERLMARDGISSSTFDDRQHRLLLALLTEIIGMYGEKISRPRIDSLDTGALSFAWMGDANPGRPHYFRIQGRSFVFEMDASQGDGSHVHTVWRERYGDLGEDVLSRHYGSHRH